MFFAMAAVYVAPHMSHEIAMGSAIAMILMAVVALVRGD